MKVQKRRYASIRVYFIRVHTLAAIFTMHAQFVFAFRAATVYPYAIIRYVFRYNLKKLLDETSARYNRKPLVTVVFSTRCRIIAVGSSEGSFSLPAMWNKFFEIPR